MFADIPDKWTQTQVIWLCMAQDDIDNLILADA